MSRGQAVVVWVVFALSGTERLDKQRGCSWSRWDSTSTKELSDLSIALWCHMDGWMELHAEYSVQRPLSQPGLWLSPPLHLPSRRQAEALPLHVGILLRSTPETGRGCFWHFRPAGSRLSTGVSFVSSTPAATRIPLPSACDSAACVPP